MLLTKLHRPNITPEHVLRKTLLNKLAENNNRPFSLIAAPAGYGKSSLVSSWIESKSLIAGWVSLSEEENDFDVFLEYLITAIDRLFPKALEGTREMIKSIKVSSSKKISNSFINEVDALNNEFYLVLDDYHNIVNPEIHGFINELLNFPPEGLHLVIITRIDPPLKLNILRAYNRMCEIRMQDLSFDKELIGELFENLQGIKLDDHVTEQLLKTTEGWITALILFSFAFKQSIDQTDFLQNIPKKSILTHTFLFEEVFKKQNKKIQELLMISSLFDQFSNDLIDNVLSVLKPEEEFDHHNSEFVNWLRKANFFIVPLDDEFKWYRYHHIFQELLRLEAKKYFSHDEIVVIYNTSGIFFNKVGIIDTAVKSFIKSENYAKATEIILQRSREFSKNESWSQIKNLCDKLPRKVVDANPALMMIDAWHAYMCFNLEVIPLVLERVEPFLSKEMDHNLRAEIHFMKGNIHYWMGDTENALIQLNKAIEQIDDDQVVVRSESILIWAFAKHMAGEEVEAIAYINNLLLEENLHHRIRGYAYGGLTFIALLSGNISDSISLSRKMMNVVSKCISYSLLAWGEFLMASSSFQNYNLDNVIKHFKTNLEYHYSFDVRGVVDAYVGMILAYQFKGQFEEVYKSLKLLEEFVSSKNDPYYSLVLSSLKSRLCILQKKNLREKEWLKYVGDEIFNGSLFIWLEVSEITKVRVLLSENDPKGLDEASIIIEKLLKCIDDANFICQKTDVLTLKSLLHFKKGETKYATEILKECIDFARPNAWKRPFVETFIHDNKFLLHLEIEPSYANFAEEINRIILEYNSNLSCEISNELSNGKTSLDHAFQTLTKRENETLSFLSKGLRNKEIADIMCISTDAVKKNFYRIFQKLNVKNRIELLNKAKDIGLLELV